jgi:hypothetical protein
MIKRLIASVGALTLLAGGLVASTAPAVAAPNPAPSGKAGAPTKAVKGHPSVKGVKALTACSSPCFNYAGQQYMSSSKNLTATKSTLRIAMPSRDTPDYHTLAETAITSAVSGTVNNTVEVGWNIDPVVNGDDQPHLFVYAWYNDSGVQGQCGYNGLIGNPCGWVDNASNPINAGSNIFADKDTEQAFEVYHYAASSRWIINYKGVQVGYYPDSFLHSSAYTTADYIQNFGEVASAKFPSCTNMGSGNFPNLNGQYPTHGTEFKAFNIATGGSYGTANYTSNIETDSTSWSLYPYTSGAFRFGGPGAGSPQTSPSPCP